jgi:hypothetical protein
VIIAVEVKELAVEGRDLVADLLQERFQARADPAGVGETGELVQVDAETRDLPHHRERRSGRQDGDAPVPQEMAEISREVEGGRSRSRDRGRVILGEDPEDEIFREP